MEYSIISNRQLAAKVNGRIKSGPAYVAETCNVMFNCIERAIIHNDANWLNRGAAYARASGPYVTAFMSVAKTVSPFADEKGVFGGKMLKGKSTKWRTAETVEHGDYRDERWYQYLVEKFDAMLKDRTDAANRKPTEFDPEKWADNAIKTALSKECLELLYVKIVAAKVAKTQKVADGLVKEKVETRQAA
jgi:hypothetical protein